MTSCRRIAVGSGPGAPVVAGLGLRSRRLDEIGVRAPARHSGVRRLALSDIDLGGDADLFASDGFHPAEALRAEFADRIHQLIDEGPQR